MNNILITKTRIALIKVGKVAPFVVCAIVGISYIEDVYALLCNKYVEFYDGVYLEKSVSWFIGNYFKYDIGTLLVLTILSCAIMTCRWNKLACLYLGTNLIEKSYFDFELDIETIYCICIINIIASTYLTYKGIKIITKQ